MKLYVNKTMALITALVLIGFVSGVPAYAFESGSTGTDGVFNPTVNTELQVPPNGIFNFTSVNIPSSVTVTFRRNTTNTPVVILASGAVTVAGVININGKASTNVGAAGNGNLGDDGIPGVGGPGGYDGGRGGLPVPQVPQRGGGGLGPGGGIAGIRSNASNFCASQGTISFGGGGGGFGAVGGNADAQIVNVAVARGGPAYGTSALLPLIGGSGGAGGAGSAFSGSGGGGAGGAILIASSGTLTITGQILANGGASGVSAGAGAGATGGGGSGGAIRLMATTIAGNGILNAVGAAAGATAQCFLGGAGAIGRIRLEAEIITRSAGSTPQYPPVTAPTTVFVAGFPTLRITSVAGIAAPTEPTGNADITLPATTANPVTVDFATTSVPVGNTVKLTVKPASGAAIVATSPALVGTTVNATASVQVDLPSGPSVLEATTTFTIVASLGQELGNQFAQGERVEKIEVSAGTQGPSRVTLITVSGKRIAMPGPLPAMPAAG